MNGEGKDWFLKIAKPEDMRRPRKISTDSQILEDARVAMNALQRLITKLELAQMRKARR